MDAGSVTEALKLLMMMNAGFQEPRCSCREGGPHTCMSPAASTIASILSTALQSMSASLDTSKVASKQHSKLSSRRNSQGATRHSSVSGTRRNSREKNQPQHGSKEDKSSEAETASNFSEKKQHSGQQAESIKRGDRRHGS